MAGKKPSFRKHLSKPGLLTEVRRCFEAISDDVNGRRYSLADYLMSGVSLFALKFPSLLQFDRDTHDEGPIRSNLRSLLSLLTEAAQRILDCVATGTLRPRPGQSYELRSRKPCNRWNRKPRQA